MIWFKLGLGYKLPTFDLGQLSEENESKRDFTNLWRTENYLLVGWKEDTVSYIAPIGDRGVTRGGQEGVISPSEGHPHPQVVKWNLYQGYGELPNWAIVNPSEKFELVPHPLMCKSLFTPPFIFSEKSIRVTCLLWLV